ncbi:MAG: hypothetical protein ACLTV0_12705, partial [Faecalimonas sp.]
AEYRVNGNSGNWIQGFCRDEQQNLEKERVAGTIDYDESILLLFISVDDCIDIFGNPADCAVYLDFLRNWKSEKAISC